MSESKIKLNTVWYEGSKGNGKIQGDNVSIPIAIPVNKAGSGEGAEPKQLLVSSAIACYAMTLVYMLESKKIPISNFSMDTERTSREGITHYPHVILNEDVTEEQLEEVNLLFQKAHEQCYIGDLLSKAGVPIQICGKTTIK